VRNLLALRGDPPGGGEFQAVPGGFQYSAELVKFIRQQGDFSIGVAGFPEGHIACKAGKYQDWAYLRAKIDAGADFLITQLFFDNADFLEFRGHMTRHHGVTIPLVPGVIPIMRASQIKRFTELSGARIPKALAKKLDELGDNDPAVAEFGIEFATRQCESLLAQGAPGIHFYTLNRPEATVRILKNLGLFAPTG
jgi:methylenetetrahydrofolate reductase (NADPH)